LRVKQALAAAILAVSAVSGGAFAQQVCKAPPEARSVPSARYLDNADGTVTDKELQLMWARCSIGQVLAGAACTGDALSLTFAAATAAAADVNARGELFFSDWRLPAVAELASIAERECVQPRTNLDIFPDTRAAPYWSGTAQAGGRAGVFYSLDFGIGGVRLDDEQETNHVRLVRRAR
jgi:hypothetical protein